MKWKILDTGSADAAQNMALDYALLKDLPSIDCPILHLYEWSGPSATYGHFTDPFSLLHKDAVAEYGLQLAKRPTGGGIIFHTTDFAFSLLIPASHPSYSLNTLENYGFINSIVSRIIKKFQGATPFLLKNEQPLFKAAGQFCMAKPTKYDVMIGSRKVAGAAQRRTRDGYLHQGSLSLKLPPEEFLLALLKDFRVAQAMQAATHCLAQDDLSEARKTLKTLFLEELQSSL